MISTKIGIQINPSSYLSSMLDVVVWNGSYVIFSDGQFVWVRKKRKVIK